MTVVAHAQIVSQQSLMVMESQQVVNHTQSGARNALLPHKRLATGKRGDVDVCSCSSFRCSFIRPYSDIVHDTVSLQARGPSRGLLVRTTGR